MNCIKCGALLEEGDAFCKNCGAPVQNISSNNNTFSYESNNNPVQPNTDYMPEQNQPTNFNTNQNQQMNYTQPQTNQQQNYNMQQQPQTNYAQTNPNGQTNQSNKNNNGIKIAVIVIILIAIIGSLLFIGYSILKVSNKNDDNNNIDVVEEDDNNIDISQNVDKSKAYKVYYQGFTYYIPDNLIYNIGDELYIGDDEQTWVASLYSGQGSYQQLKQNKNSISSSLTRELANNGITANASPAEVETIDNIEYITVEVTSGGESCLIAYTQLNSMYFLCISLTNEDNDINKELLKNLSSIINTAEYDQDSHYLKDGSQIDASKLINVINE